MLTRTKTIKWYLSEYFLSHDESHPDNDWKMKGGKFLNRYGNGNALINIFKDFLFIIGMGGILIGMRLNWSLWIFFILGLLWFIGCYTLGFWNEFFGFWGKQNIHSTGSKEIQPIFSEMRDDIKTIKQKIKQIEEKIIEIINNFLKWKSK